MRARPPRRGHPGRTRSARPRSPAWSRASRESPGTPGPRTGRGPDEGRAERAARRGGRAHVRGLLRLQPREEVESRHALEPLRDVEEVARPFERGEALGGLLEVLESGLHAPAFGRQVLRDRPDDRLELLWIVGGVCRPRSGRGSASFRRVSGPRTGAGSPWRLRIPSRASPGSSSRRLRTPRRPRRSCDPLRRGARRRNPRPTRGPTRRRSASRSRTGRPGRGRTPCGAPPPCRGWTGGEAARGPPTRGRVARHPWPRTASSSPRCAPPSRDAPPSFRQGPSPPGAARRSRSSGPSPRRAPRSPRARGRSGPVLAVHGDDVQRQHGNLFLGRYAGPRRRDGRRRGRRLREERRGEKKRRARADLAEDERGHRGTGSTPRAEPVSPGTSSCRACLRAIRPGSGEGPSASGPP